MKEGIDKLLLISPTELWICFTHRTPVCVSGPDAYALYLWMNAPTPLRLVEFQRAIVSDTEVTQAAAAA